MTEVSKEAREPTVTQADREAAAKFAFDHVDEFSSGSPRLEGEWLTNLVQAFARHREQALASSSAVLAAAILKVEFPDGEDEITPKDRKVASKYADRLVAALTGSTP